ncbi:hypothetical protein HMPREF3230_00750 [Gardnerella vaginalis]|uniref:Uncharacterized protein n=1 Tax=Gardnerella vaginalis TaxID=2702 RepID=A0A135Z662_GARVA|nr:hypothetical protein HMPREF3230_00750 [Gardnerella vaginalis]
MYLPHLRNGSMLSISNGIVSIAEGNPTVRIEEIHIVDMIAAAAAI